MQVNHPLLERIARISLIEDGIGILHWSAETMKLEGAADSHSHQLAMLKGTAHDVLTVLNTGELLARVDEDSYRLDDWQCAYLRDPQPLTAGIFRTHLRERYHGH
ncbi:hypothetical protein [Microvirga rosea]|uniref:hypothetical protein n=1 Tax=Microvirga rosea TaxID=2715425 RepID=UPI001D0BC897|nr:hypothetical protein [Microvirga rosea]MCB8823307.1 hypothetical protein [Microvirga rosea]